MSVIEYVCKKKEVKLMKRIYKNRFLVWLMFLVPITFTGWSSVIIWTVIQLALCESQYEKQKEYEAIEKERRIKNEKIKEKNKQDQIKRARELKLEYAVIDGEVYLFEYEDK